MQRWIKHNGIGAHSVLSAIALSFVLSVVATPLAQAKGQVPEASANTIALADLPKQGRDTYALILTGGPFPYEKDGSVFGNRERQLPAQKRGYYREYTVKTPSSRDRGALRIVCGGSQVVKPEVCYYTDNHYASFKRIAP